MTHKPTIIITGANGLLGSELVRYFSTNEYSVRALVRNPNLHNNSRYITYLSYDMQDNPDDAIFQSADYLVHTAYIKGGVNIIEQNINAATKLLDKSRKYHLQKNIFISSMSSDKNALSEYGRQKYAIEQLFRAKSDTVIRSGLIIGSGGLAQQIIHFMKSKHVAPLIDNGKQPIQIIGVHDMARVIEAIIDKDVSGTFNIATPRVYTYKEFYQSIRSKLHIIVLLIPVPFFIPLLVIRSIHLLRLPFAITEDNLQGLKQLRSYETESDLQKLDITLSELDDVLTEQLAS